MRIILLLIIIVLVNSKTADDKACTINGYTVTVGQDQRSAVCDQNSDLTDKLVILDNKLSVILKKLGITANESIALSSVHDASDHLNAGTTFTIDFSHQAALLLMNSAVVMIFI